MLPLFIITGNILPVKYAKKHLLIGAKSAQLTGVFIGIPKAFVGMNNLISERSITCDILFCLLRKQLKILFSEISMHNKEFVTKIAAMEDPEDVQAAFAEHGMVFAMEQINRIAEMVMSINADELNEDVLEGVSGGVLAEIAIVTSGIALFANTMAEVKKSRKAAGKKTFGNSGNTT